MGETAHYKIWRGNGFKRIGCCVVVLLLGVLSGCRHDFNFKPEDSVVLSHGSLKSSALMPPIQNSLSQEILKSSVSRSEVDKALSIFLLDCDRLLNSELRERFPQTRFTRLSTKSKSGAASLERARIQSVITTETSSSITTLKKIHGSIPFTQLRDKTLIETILQTQKVTYFMGYRITLNWQDARTPVSRVNRDGRDAFGPQHGDPQLAWQRYVKKAKEHVLEAQMKLWVQDAKGNLLLTQTVIGECPLSTIRISSVDLSTPHSPFIRALSVLKSQLKANLRASLK